MLRPVGLITVGIVALLCLPACSSTTTTGGSGGQATGGGGGSAHGGSGGSSSAMTCTQLCDLATTSTSTQDNCVAGFVHDVKGYPTDTSVPCQLLAADKTVANCNACYADIKITNADCASAHATCF